MLCQNKKLATLVSLASVFWTVAVASAADPFGSWISADGAVVIDVAPCGTEVCGVIVAFQAEEYPVRDRYNPRPELRQRPVCGLRVLGGRLDADLRWIDGWVYDASDGNHYRVTRVDAHDARTLTLEIQYGIFSRPVVLQRSASATVRCKPPLQFHSFNYSRP
jgi:uncharacterized protein (DUF2147 family)